MMAKHVSRPIKSAKRSGPMGTPVPFFMIASMSSRVATAVSRHMTASLMYGMRMRFAMKPGVSRDVEGVLPIAVTKARARERVSGEVWSAVMISTPGWMGTGFIKWVLRTRGAAAGPAAAASLVIERLEVFVASMASEGVRAGRREKMSSLRERIS